MSFLELLDKSLLLNGSEATSKDDLLAKISRLLLKHPELKGMSQDMLKNLFKERESLGTTGVGHGIAIPHCRVDGIDDFIVSIVTFPEGVEYEAMDDKPVVVAIAIVGPKDDNKGYVRLLSEISCLFRNPEKVRMVVSADSPEKIMQILHGEENTSDKCEPESKYDMVHLFVRNEDTFNDILEIFASLDLMATVHEVTPIEGYLSKLPLFTNFWLEREAASCRKISSIIESKSRDELVHLIDDVVGGIDKSDEICLVIQPASYVAGSIGIG